MTLITLHNTSVTEHALSPLTPHDTSAWRGIEKIRFLSYRGDVILKAERAVCVAPGHADIVCHFSQNKKEKKEKIFFEIRLHTVGRGEKLKLS
jgi:hypothetical protein